jgi:CRISPR-associated endonuclease/helicase Cas3
MQLRLLPVYSKLAEPALVETALQGRRLPDDMRLSEHQVRTLMALEDPAIDVIVNTAMTGDGKSLAAYLRSLIGPPRAAIGDEDALGTVLSMYPTIELSRDQKRQFDKYQELFGHLLRAQEIWGAKLTELAEGGNRSEALLHQLQTQEVILTNPDIFNSMINYTYHTRFFSAQEIPQMVVDFYGLYLFDEFHLFSMPQFASAMTALVYAQQRFALDRIHRAPKAIFSSATQNEDLFSLIRAAGLRMMVIPGSYTSQEAPATHRKILELVDFHLHQLTPEQTVENWVLKNLDVIERLWRESGRRQARAAIIVSSIAVAHRLAKLLREHFATSPLKPGGLRVAEITGLHRGSVQDDIIVGTSTVDVGVDFDINLLIFEAANAGQFLQRLGRLGRYHHDREPMGPCQAHAIISGKTPWISAAIAKNLGEVGVNDGDEVERPQVFRDAIVASYLAENSFRPYLTRWAGLQGSHIIDQLRNQLREKGESTSRYEAFAARLETAYGQLFLKRADFAPIRRRYWALKKDQRSGKQIRDAVLSFRGGSPFQVGYWDASEPETTAESFTTYDLFFIVQATRWERVSFDAFNAAAKGANLEKADLTRLDQELRWTLKHREEPVCLRIHEFLPEREWLLLELSREDDVEEEIIEQIRVMRGIRIKTPTGPTTGDLNSILTSHAVLAYISRRSREDFWRKGISTLFPLYRIQLPRTKDVHTICFGKEALMVESLERTWRHHPKQSSAFII